MNTLIKKWWQNKLWYIRCVYYRVKYAWKFVKSKITMLNRRNLILWLINHMSVNTQGVGWGYRIKIRNSIFILYTFLFFTEIKYCFGNNKETNFSLKSLSVKECGCFGIGTKIWEFSEGEVCPCCAVTNGMHSLTRWDCFCKLYNQ